MTHTHAKGQAQRSFSSKVKSGNGWTNGRMEEIALLDSLAQSVVIVTKKICLINGVICDMVTLQIRQWTSILELVRSLRSHITTTGKSIAPSHAHSFVYNALETERNWIL